MLNDSDQPWAKWAESLDINVRFAVTIAQMQRQYYDAVIKEGFTKDEALTMTNNLLMVVMTTAAIQGNRDQGEDL